MEKLTLGTGDVTAEIWTRGAAVNDLRVPDRTGRIASVVLGYSTDEDRLAGTGYLGEIVGPFANRIAAGGYVIDGQAYTPDLNDHGAATLHGGAHGFSYQDWEISDADNTCVRLKLDWSDPLGGFPGPIRVEVDYTLDGWSLTHRVRATCEAPTPLSIVSHPYFNLSGSGETIDGHELQIDASAYLPTDGNLIPLPEAPMPVEGTAFDFRTPTLISKAIASQEPQVTNIGGIDHALILDGQGMRKVAQLRHQASGRELTIITDYPALQIYTGHMMEDPNVAHPLGAGVARSGVAVETEEYPDAPRRPDFPSVLVRPGQEYVRTTTWEFRAR